MNETWYDKSIEQLEHRFSTDRGAGLSQSAAAKARRKYGQNNVYPTPQNSFFGFRGHILTDFTSYLLLAAAAIAAVFGKPVEAGVIVLMMIINYAAVIFIFVKAQRVLEGMTAYSLPTAKVMRQGKLILIDMRALVPGDVIFLSAGDIVPADCRIFYSENLYINEGMLTGVKSSVRKDAEFSYFSPGLAPERQQNVAFASTVVTSGNARCIVTATGEATLACEMGKTKPVTTHENLKIFEKLRKYCARTSVTMLIIVFIVTAADLFYGYANEGVFDVFITGIALAAASMAELYTAFGYIIIGCGIFSAMKRKHDVNVGALIKNAEKLEVLRDIDCLVIPKDGMITQSHALAEKIYLPRRLYSALDRDRRDSFRDVVLHGVVSTGIYGVGLSALNMSPRRISSEEDALISLASELGLYNSDIERNYPIIEHKPAGGASKFETTLVLNQQRQYMAVCRGDAEMILNSCEYYVERGSTFRMDTDDRLAFLDIARNLTKNSYIVTAIASGVTGYNNLQRIGSIQSDLVFEGFVAIREPLQPGIAQTISRCRAAGIHVIMTTDRYTETNKFLAMSVGIINSESEILTGERVQYTKSDLLRANLPLYNMYCGIPATQLAGIIDTLRADGARVGLLAGGINGALLLRHADVGFAQSVTISPKASRGEIDIKSRQTPAYSRITGPTGKTFDSEALKFISDVVVSDADDRGEGGFTAVVSALEYSRSIWRNLTRILRYLITVQLTRIFLIFASVFTSISFLGAEQLVFSGLIVDFFAVISAAFAKPPHDALTLDTNVEALLDRPLTQNIRSIVFALFETILLMSVTQIPKRIGLEISDAEIMSVVYISFLLFSLVSFIELASERSIFSANLRVNIIFAVYILFIAGFIALSLLVPAVGGIFGITALSPISAVAVAVLTIITILLNEIYKLVTRRAH